MGQVIDLQASEVKEVFDQVDNLVHADFSQQLEQEEVGNLAQATKDVYALANMLIEKHPVHLGHLIGVPIKFLFSLKPKVKSGRQVLGTAKAFPAAAALLHPYKFQITLDQRYWLDNPHKREPLLFHEMLHCFIDEKDKCGILAHDLEEFSAVVRHYGLWREDVRDFSRQIELFEDKGSD